MTKVYFDEIEIKTPEQLEAYFILFDVMQADATFTQDISEANVIVVDEDYLINTEIHRKLKNFMAGELCYLEITADGTYNILSSKPSALLL